jgi:hypothetical protein
MVGKESPRKSPQELLEIRQRYIEAGVKSGFATPEQGKIFQEVAKLEFNLYSADCLSAKGDLANAVANYNFALQRFDDIQLRSMRDFYRVGDFNPVLQICYKYIQYVGSLLDKRNGHGSAMGEVGQDLRDGWDSMFS